MDQNKFKELQRKWYKKLLNDGFVDIENENHQLRDFETQKYSKNIFNGLPFADWIRMKLAKMEYYTLARQFIYIHKFPSVKIKKIWSMHAEGLSCRQIEDITGLNYKEVWKITHSIALKMLKERLNENDSEQ
jgi:hypothetical protein